jgi:photosystem II stability/assembly factor-like uncharacterized protein
MAEEHPLQDITYALAASPNFAQDGVCFAARRSGLYRSEDGGSTWRSAYEALELETPLATMAVAESPSFESDHSVFAGVPGGILRSYDSGMSWHIATLPSPPPVVTSLVVSPQYAQDSTLLVGTLEDGVFRSGDRGSHWAAWNFGLLDLNVLCLAISPQFAQDGTLFAGTETGIFRSTNGGRAWREVNLPTDWAPVLSLGLSPGYATDGILFAGTESHGLFGSSDRGRTWARLGQEVIGGAVNGILLSSEFATTADILVILSDLLLVSRDKGVSWSNWHADVVFEQGIACAVAPQGLGPEAQLLVGLVEGGVLQV